METSRWAPIESATPTSYADDATPFAQTGGETNDLFADDFTPIAQPVSQPVPPEAPRTTVPNVRTPRVDGDAKRSRGRGRGGRAIPPPIPSHHDGEEAQETVPESAEASNDQAQASSKANAVVRGDRSKTGGVTRPRLTEEELTAKLEAVRLNNAKREEAHRAAEADEASFKAQEAHAHERRKEENLNRKKMEAEREKNRARKLARQGVREWDEGKEQQDFGRARGSGYRRGAHGAVQGLPASLQSRDVEGGRAMWDQDEGEGRYGRQMGDYGGRGGRGGRGRGRGRGRGGADGFRAGRGESQGAPPSLGDAEFPALGEQTPATTTADTKASEEVQTKSEPKDDIEATQSKLEPPSSIARSRHARSPWRVTDEPKTSWADQVEEGG